jgi:hypothetical protein
VLAVLSPDDALFCRYLPPWQLRLLRKMVHLKSGQLLHRKLAPLLVKMILVAQGRAESDAFARRWSVLRADEWLERALPFDDTHRY